MNELIKYLISLLNIKTDSEFVVLDMREDLSTIRDINKYRLFMKSNINNYEVQFMSGYQKFVFLTDKYKAKEFREVNAERIAGAESEAQRLDSKFTSIKTKLKNELHCGRAATVSHINHKDTGGKYFTDFEIGVLNRIGGTKNLIYLSDVHCLQVEIERSFLSYLCKDMNVLGHSHS